MYDIAVGRALGLDKQRRKHTGVAIRGYLEMTELDHIIEGYLLSEFVPGYAWIFPVNKQLANVGIGTRVDVLKKKQLSLVQGLHHFLSSPDILPRIPDVNKRLDEKQYHPQDIEDDRYHTHNDDVGWHSKYTPFLHWQSSIWVGVVSVKNCGAQDGSIDRWQVHSSRYPICLGARASPRGGDQPSAVQRDSAVG